MVNTSQYQGEQELGLRTKKVESRITSKQAVTDTPHCCTKTPVSLEFLTSVYPVLQRRRTRKASWKIEK